MFPLLLHYIGHRRLFLRKVSLQQTSYTANRASNKCKSIPGKSNMILNEQWKSDKMMTSVQDGQANQAFEANEDNNVVPDGPEKAKVIYWGVLTRKPLKDMEFQFIYVCSLLSNTKFVNKQNGSKLIKIMKIVIFLIKQLIYHFTIAWSFYIRNLWYSLWFFRSEKSYSIIDAGEAFEVQYSKGQ